MQKLIPIDAVPSYWFLLRSLAPNIGPSEMCASLAAVEARARAIVAASEHPLEVLIHTLSGYQLIARFRLKPGHHPKHRPGRNHHTDCPMIRDDTPARDCLLRS